MKIHQKRRNIIKHIILSNTFMIMLSLVALYVPLFSNQVELAYLNGRQLAHIKDDRFVQNDRFDQKICYAQYFSLNHSQSIRQTKRMSLFSRWITSHSQFDGLQFYKNQYQYQPNFAFIRGYTIIIQGVKLIVVKIDQNLIKLNKIKESMNSEHLQLLILILINKIFFSLTAFKIYSIGQNLTKNTKISHNITLLYIYNPACVFFHSIYTQSIYGFLSLTSLQYFLESQKSTNKEKKDEKNQIYLGINLKYVKSLLYLWLSVFLRTNAVFLSPIYGIPLIYQLWLEINKKNIINTLKIFIKGIFILSIILSPLIYYQIHIYQQLCHSQIDLQNDSQLITECNKLFPNLYSFIQQKFWNVGLFSYWKPSNFLFIIIGIPALVISSSIFKKIFTSWKHQQYLITKEFLITFGLYFSFLILFVITLTLTNIQSSTRFFSTHVIFYILLQSLFKFKINKIWLFLYYSFGAILFFIGFPWT